MSLLREPRPDDQQMVRYLLRLLPDDEEEQLDEMSIADEETAWRLRVAENDLVDAYVNGALTGDTLARFESYFLASERRREKVKFARSLRTAASARAARSAPGPLTAPARTWWGFAAAATLVLVAGGTLVWQDVRLRTEIDQARTQTAAVRRQAAEIEQRLPNAATTATSGSRFGSVHNTLVTQSHGRTTSPVLSTVALTLLPQTRSVGAVTELAVPPGTDRVAFDLRLESNRFPGYRVTLKDPATGKSVWQSGEVTARSVDSQPTVSGVFPANVLKLQHYSIEVTGHADDETELVGSYALEVVSR